LNLGKGEYTAIFHSDDIYSPTMVEKEVRYLEANKDTSGVLTFATQIDAEGGHLKTYIAPSSLGMKLGDAKSFTAAELFKAILIHDNFLFCPSALMRTDICLSQIGSWRGDLFKSSADLDVWLRLASINHLALINEPLLFYRISDVQWTAKYRRNRKVRADTFLVLEYWLKNEKITQFLTDVDRVNYQKLKRQDALGCVLNAINNDDLLYAKKVWVKEDCFSIIKAFPQLKTTRDLKFIALSSVLYLILFPVVGVFFKIIFISCLSKLRL
jgi:hypothetical protein